MQREDQDPRIPERLGRDLQAAFGGSVGIPPDLDRELSRRARRNLGRNRWRVVRRVASLAAAVIAALLLGQLVLTGPERAATEILREDFDGSGKVDILDAYRLALQLRRGETPASGWDLDGDGVVDQRDANTIAQRAVSIAERGGP